jgi:O-acetyl-ADP-ribose deacetylase (regulator of RNase III)
MSVKIIESDIFWTGAKFIAHQCNCTSNGGAAGIAKEIFAKYPYSNCYYMRTEAATPGTIEVCGDGLNHRGIINMFSQYFPGGPDTNETDDEKARKKWFHQCLMEITKVPNLESIAFPYKIGCGIAGGDWNWYSAQIDKFALFMKDKAQVLIYKIED